MQKQAEKMGVTDSQYLRMLITNRPRDYPSIRQELQRLNNEINHIGVNINQITHNNNGKLYLEEDKHRLYILMKRLKDLLNQILDKL
jgi:spore cortex formation protein SpoVR/YcgB (stage V sporulation)